MLKLQPLSLHLAPVRSQNVCFRILSLLTDFLCNNPVRSYQTHRSAGKRQRTVCFGSMLTIKRLWGINEYSATHIECGKCTFYGQKTLFEQEHRTSKTCQYQLSTRHSVWNTHRAQPPAYTHCSSAPTHTQSTCCHRQSLCPVSTGINNSATLLS